MFTFTKATPRKPAALVEKLSGGHNPTLAKLRSFLNANEPKTVEFLVSFWNAQGNAITYKELREAYLNGGISQPQFAKWQKQYANLVNNALAPQWYAAIKAAGMDVKAQYPYFLYEPFVGAMQSYIKQHGAELVTVLAQEQRDALQSMIANAAHYQGTTADELSRLMRAAIGLTKPQALANLHYYESLKEQLLKTHPRMTEASAAAKAQEAAAKYAARQHRYRAMNIARTELAAAYNQGHYGATKDAQAQGYIGECEKFFVTADDERVCPACGVIDGESKKMDEPFSFGKLLPPVHPSCRCAVGYREIASPVTAPKKPGAASTAGAKPPPTNQPEIPQDIAIPNGMTYNGEIKLGGTGKMYSYFDADGNEWLFKPAQNKAGRPELFRAYSQEVGYKVQGLVDPDSAVKVGTGTLDGRFGAFQQRVKTVTGNDFKKWQHGSGMTDADITPEMVEQFQREHVTDWLLGNFDSHGGNFVTSAAGKIIGIDKEQAFKYLSDASSKVMSYSYHPNSYIGETEPIYNTLFRKFAHGNIDLNPQNTLKYIQRLEAVPDSQYREIFRNYAESLCGKGKAAEDMLDAILARKSSLRETYRTFYSDLLTERTGTKQAFKWADEIASATKPAAIAPTKEQLRAAALAKPKDQRTAEDWKAIWDTDTTKWDQLSGTARRDMLGPYQKSWISKLTSDERDAVRTYSGSMYREINAYARTGSVAPGYSESELKELNEQLGSAFAKAELGSDIRVARGVHGAYAEAIRNYKPGQIDIQKAVTSTSYSTDAAFTGLTMDISIPAGTGRGSLITELSRYGEGEREFLLAPGAKLRFIEYDPAKDRAYFELMP